jgi:8-oxo-dGTP diphosphatase/2-hydroxy-dATP diphosphatase
MHKLLTLCLIHQPPRILLGMKKAGFGQGRWNGFGGKVQDGETIEQAARREVLEEAGITVGPLEHYGILTFSFETEPDTLEVHVFRARSFEGEPTESDEMRPQWFAEDTIPYDAMWADDRHWLPHFLQSKHVRGSFHFADHHTILRQELAAFRDAPTVCCYSDSPWFPPPPSSAMLSNDPSC